MILYIFGENQLFRRLGKKRLAFPVLAIISYYNINDLKIQLMRQIQKGRENTKNISGCLRQTVLVTGFGLRVTSVKRSVHCSKKQPPVTGGCFLLFRHACAFRERRTLRKASRMIFLACRACSGVAGSTPSNGYGMSSSRYLLTPNT